MSLATGLSCARTGEPTSANVATPAITHILMTQSSRSSNRAGCNTAPASFDPSTGSGLRMRKSENGITIDATKKSASPEPVEGLSLVLQPLAGPSRRALSTVSRLPRGCGDQLRRAHMLGAEADADEARRDAAQDRPAAQQPERQRQRQRSSAAEHAADDAVLDQQLQALDEARRQLAPMLHLIERLA